MSNLTQPLIPLQDLDRRIHTCRGLLKKKPEELAEHQGKLDRAAAMVEELRQEVHDLRKDADGRELQVKECDERIQKLTVQSNQAKKNDEYQGLLKEISGVRADRGRVEDGLLDIYMQLDEKKKLEGLRLEEQEEAKKAFAAAEAEMKAACAELEGQIAEWEEKRKAHLEGIGKEVLREYQRVLDAKEDGKALALLLSEVIKDDGQVSNWYTCGGCNVNVTAQQVNLVLMGRELVHCRACSRILYAEDDILR